MPSRRTIEDHEFYRVCTALLEKPFGETDWSTVPDPVREVVFGFAYIINALANYKPKLPHDADEKTRRAHTHWLQMSGLGAAIYVFGAYRAILDLHAMSKRKASALVSKRFSEYVRAPAAQTIKDTDTKLWKD